MWYVFFHTTTRRGHKNVNRGCIAAFRQALIQMPTTAPTYTRGPVAAAGASRKQSKQRMHAYIH